MLKSFILIIYVQKYIYIILPLLLIIILNLYLVTFYYNENVFIQKIIQGWNNKTNGGYIKLDKNDLYKDDFYLSIHNYHDRDSHIHLIKTCDQSHLLCYIIKKDNKHSKLHIINENTNIDHIVYEMIENYNNFE
jgi:hypothetical protein